MTTQPPSKRSRIVFWLGCAGCLFVLILLGVGGTLAWLLYSSRPRGDQAQLPPGWRDSLRAQFQLPPELARLAPGPGGDSVIADIASLGMPADTMMRGRSPATLRLRRGLPAEPPDAAVIARAAADTTLDRFYRASFAGRYDVMDRMADRGGRPRMMAPLGEGVSLTGTGVLRSVEGLTLRGESALRRGDVARARADFEAVLRFARMMWRSEVSGLGVRLARSMMEDGAQGMARLARREGNEALAADAAAVYTWARNRDRFFFHYDDADTTLSLAADSALPRGIRIDAMANVPMMSVVIPVTRVVFGPKAETMRQVRRLTTDPDPAVARAAVIADSTMARLDRMWPLARFRTLSRGPR